MGRRPHFFPLFLGGPTRPMGGSEFTISTTLRDFLRENVVSYEQLEVLLLLRAHPKQAWSQEAVARELKLPEAAAEEALEHVARLHLARVTGGGETRRYTYAAEGGSFAAVVDELARTYGENRIAIMNLMNAN